MDFKKPVVMALFFEILLIISMLLSENIFLKAVLAILFAVSEVLLMYTLFDSRKNFLRYYLWACFFAGLVFLIVYLPSGADMFVTIFGIELIVGLLIGLLFSAYVKTRKVKLKAYKFGVKEKLDEQELMARELGKEAAQLETVDKLVKDVVKLKKAEKLQRKISEDEKQEKELKKFERKAETEELYQEAAILTEAQEEVDEMIKQQKRAEIITEAATLERAQDEINKLQNEIKRKELVREAKQLVKAQKEIDRITKAAKKAKKKKAGRKKKR